MRHYGCALTETHGKGRTDDAAMAATSTPRARSKQEKNASKQKNKQYDWYECALCRRVIHSRNTLQHEEACKSVPRLEHGYIVGAKLHGKLTLSSAVSEIVESCRVPSSKKNSVIYVHPSVMTPCNLATGFPCVVNGCCVLLAWPCERLPPVSIVLPIATVKDLEEMGQSLEEGTLVTVETFTTAGHACAQKVEVEIRPARGIFPKKDFTELLPVLMEGMYIMEGGVHTLKYFGQDCMIFIKKVSHQHLHTEKNSSSSGRAKADDVTDLDLSSLNISDVSEAGDVCRSVLSPGTPVSNSFADNSSSPLLQTPVTTNDKKPGNFSTPVFGRSKQTPSNDMDKFVLVTSETKFAVLHSDEEVGKKVMEKKKGVLSCIRGLDKQIQTLRELSGPLLQSQTHGLITGTNSCGVLLYGPPGTGKTALAKALAEELQIFTVEIPVHSIWSKIYGETERKLCCLFQSARERSPSLIIMDNMDALCPRPGAHQTDLEKRVTTTVLSLLDGVLSRTSETSCMVLGITSDVNSIDPALRTPGHLDNDVQTAVPFPEERLQILNALVQNKPHQLTDMELKNLADSTHGFVGADLFGLVKDACILAIKGSIGHASGEEPVLRKEDLWTALRSLSPSAMKEMKLEVPQVRWSDIGGQTEVKEKLRQAVEWPLKHPEAFTRLGILPPRGLLMYGPPGCSKTMVAKALATESGLNFLAVKGSELFSKWVGESEQTVRTVFQKARAAAPSIIFFDEMDALAVERGRDDGSSNVADRVLTQLLTEMDGVEGLGRVYVLAATNRPDMIDKALLRPGRFDNILYVSLPDDATRREILQIESRKKPLAGDVSLGGLVTRTEGYSGAELAALCNEAALLALEEDINAEEIRMDHFEGALAEMIPGTNQDMLKLYENFSHQHDLKAV